MKGLGHTAVAPDGWHERFGPRSQPLGDASAYPDKQSLLDALRKAHAAVSESVGDLDPQRMLAPPADERFHQRWPTLGEMLLHVMISHEQMHLGQLSAWRRAQGLAAV